MNKELIDNIVDEVAANYTGVYTLEYEGYGPPGTEFANDTLYHFVHALLKDILTIVDNSTDKYQCMERIKGTFHYE